MEQQIIDLYQQILLRTPNQDEIDYWLSVEADTSLAFVQQSIAASPEGVEIQTIVLPVIGLYQGLLGRAPEGEGFAFWVGAIAAGDLTIQNLIDEFAGSDEFQDANPELGDDVSAEELATIFYQNLLGRAPDAAGLEFWTDLLESGELTPASFTSAFIMTPETQERIGDAIVNYVEDIRDGDIDDPDNEGDLGEDDGEEEPGGEEPGGEEPGGEEPGGEEPGGEEPGGEEPARDNDADVGNDLTVAITEASLNLSERAAVEITVAGLDADATAVVTIDDTDDNTDAVTGTFTANGTVTADLSTLSDGQITATIVATDDDGNTATGASDMAALDATPPPSPTFVATAEFASGVPEDTAIGTVVGTLQAEGAAGFNLEGPFALDSTDTDLSDGQDVTLAESLDFEATGGTTASFSAEAVDAAGNSSETDTFDIDVTDVQELIVNSTGTAGGEFATIQEAVNFADPGAIIIIRAGTYTEQVVIGKNGISLIADDGVTITAPETLSVTATAGGRGQEFVSLVQVVDADDVTISGITVDGGDGRSVSGLGSNPTYVGIGYRNASGDVIDVTVSGIRDSLEGENVSGLQRGFGILIDNGTSSLPGENAPLKTISITGSEVIDFQKGGIYVYGADATITGNTVTGSGVEPLIAQNGIVVVGSTGSVESNTIEGLAYSGTATTSASGIIALNNRDVVIADNDITGATGTGVDVDVKFTGVSSYDSEGAVVGLNDVTNASTGYYIEGGADPEVIGGTAFADTLIGGGGSDDLSGGAGADVFQYDALADASSPAASGNAEMILDWDADDQIDLSAIDADGSAGGDQAFVFGGELVNPSSGYGVYYQHVGSVGNEATSVFIGNPAEGLFAEADLTIRLVGHHDLTADDFIL